MNLLSDAALAEKQIDLVDSIERLAKLLARDDLPEGRRARKLDELMLNVARLIVLERIADSDEVARLRLTVGDLAEMERGLAWEDIRSRALSMAGQAPSVQRA